MSETKIGSESMEAEASYSWQESLLNSYNRRPLLFTLKELRCVQ